RRRQDPQEAQVATHGLGAQAMAGGSLDEPLPTIGWPSAELGSATTGPTASLERGHRFVDSW
ncbi:MAG TPA: hypothetical protein VFY37_02695, partial [Solirubrobacterales bacterium]|nr:hypothetical protein [Solirubrobacterales bacterium]